MCISGCDGIGIRIGLRNQVLGVRISPSAPIMTRQWLVPPKLMCKQHLLGEHLEAHIFVSKMEKHYKLDGFIKGSMFFGAEYIKQRHDELARYISGHKTPLDISHIDLELYPPIEITWNHTLKSAIDLVTRCDRCKSLW